MNTIKTRDDVHRELGLGRYDPVMRELWDLKADLNREANYNVDAIIARVANVTPQNAMKHQRASAL